MAVTIADDYEELKRSSVVFDIDGVEIQLLCGDGVGVHRCVGLVASLDDIIRSKAAADRPKVRAVLPVLCALPDEIGREADGQ